MAATLEQVKALVDQLPPADRVRLVAHLMPEVPRQHSPLGSDAEVAWDRFEKTRQEIAALTQTEAPSPLDILRDMRDSR